MRTFFLLLVLGLAVAEESESLDSNEDEYGHYTTWRKAVCEKHSEDMNKDMMTCFQMSDQKVIDATQKCAEQAAPSSKGDVIAFMDIACADVQRFHKFDVCFDDYEEDPEFEKLLDVTPDVEVCYENIFEKYAMDSLKGILKEYALTVEEK